MRDITITQAVGGQGATTVALALAQAIAKYEATTYIGDAIDACAFSGFSTIDEDIVNIRFTDGGNRREVGGCVEDLHIKDRGPITRDKIKEAEENEDFTIVVSSDSYASLSRISKYGVKPDLFLVTRNKDSGLGTSDVERVLSDVAPDAYVVWIGHDPTVSRSQDAGLFLHRMPQTVRKTIDNLVAIWKED